MQDLIVRGSCGRGSLLRHLHPAAVAGCASIDLRRLRSCEPLGLVAIAAFADRAVREGGVAVTAPDDPGVARHLSRMRLGAVLDDLGVRHGLPAVRERALDGVLVELTRFDGARGVEEVAGMVHRAVETADEEAARALHEGISEVGENVPRHARRSHGFVAAQRHPTSGQLLFAVGDSGVGLLETLRDVGAGDHEHAIRLAVTEGVTRSDEIGAGVGLASIVTYVSSLGGHLHLVSGDAALTVRTGARRRAVETGELRGTVVQGAVGLRRRPA